MSESPGPLFYISISNGLGSSVAYPFDKRLQS